MPDRHGPNDLARLKRSFALSSAVVLAFIAGLFALNEVGARRTMRLEAQREALVRQVAFLTDIMQAARNHVEAPGYSEATAGALAEAVAALEATRLCPTAEGAPLAADPSLAGQYLGGDEASLCARGDAFFAAAHRLVAGEWDAFAVMFDLLTPIRDGLLLVRVALQEQIAAARRFEETANRVGYALLFVVFLARALLVFRRSFRMLQHGLRRDAERVEQIEAANAALAREARQAEEARRAAERADRVKTEFLARMSHEVRTPLNAIMGLSDIIGRAPLSEPDHERLGLIRANGARLRDMLDDTIDLARFASGDWVIEGAPFALRALLAPLIARHAEGARAKGLGFAAEIDATLPDRWIGDAPRIARVIDILLDNAVRFTPEGEVRLELAPGPGRALRIAVTDDGPGVPESVRSAIFEPFAQIDGSATRAAGGLGQGLALARAATRAMGGEIGVGTAPSGGARFWAELPLMPLRADPAPADRLDAARA